MALSIDSRDSVSFLLTIQATGPLTLALAGLTPAEYTSLDWTYDSGYWFPPPSYPPASCDRRRLPFPWRSPPCADAISRLLPGPVDVPAVPWFCRRVPSRRQRR